MRTPKERLEINQFLGRRGLATLDDPAGLVNQLGFLVQDHDHLRQLLVRCEPAERREMYESLKPHLRFEAKPLDVYLAEAGRIAEAKQLPVQAPDGKLRPFQVTELRSDEYIAQEAVNRELAKHRLILTCRKCTRIEEFTGDTQGDAVFHARLAGWTYGLDTEGKGFEICPECPVGGRAN